MADRIEGRTDAQGGQSLRPSCRPSNAKSISQGIRATQWRSFDFASDSNLPECNDGKGNKSVYETYDADDNEEETVNYEAIRADDGVYSTCRTADQETRTHATVLKPTAKIRPAPAPSKSSLYLALSMRLKPSSKRSKADMEATDDSVKVLKPTQKARPSARAAAAAPDPVPANGSAKPAESDGSALPRPRTDYKPQGSDVSGRKVKVSWGQVSQQPGSAVSTRNVKVSWSGFTSSISSQSERHSNSDDTNAECDNIDADQSKASSSKEDSSALVGAPRPPPGPPPAHLREGSRSAPEDVDNHGKIGEPVNMFLKNPKNNTLIQERSTSQYGHQSDRPTASELVSKTVAGLSQHQGDDPGRSSSSNVEVGSASEQTQPPASQQVRAQSKLFERAAPLGAAGMAAAAGKVNCQRATALPQQLVPGLQSSTQQTSAQQHFAEQWAYAAASKKLIQISEQWANVAASKELIQISSASTEATQSQSQQHQQQQPQSFFRGLDNSLNSSNNSSRNNHITTRTTATAAAATWEQAEQQLENFVARHALSRETEEALRTLAPAAIRSIIRSDEAPQSTHESVPRNTDGAEDVVIMARIALLKAEESENLAQTAIVPAIIRACPASSNCNQAEGKLPTREVKKLSDSGHSLKTHRKSPSRDREVQSRVKTQGDKRKRRSPLRTQRSKRSRSKRSRSKRSRSRRSRSRRSRSRRSRGRRSRSRRRSRRSHSRRSKSKRKRSRSKSRGRRSRSKRKRGKSKRKRSKSTSSSSSSSRSKSKMKRNKSQSRSKSKSKRKRNKSKSSSRSKNKRQRSKSKNCSRSKSKRKQSKSNSRDRRRKSEKKRSTTNSRSSRSNSKSRGRPSRSKRNKNRNSLPEVVVTYEEGQILAIEIDSDSDGKHTAAHPQPSADSTSAFPDADNPHQQKLWEWLMKLDGGKSTLLRYFPALRDEFDCDFAQLAASRLDKPISSGSVGCIEPTFFHALGVDSEEHQLLLAEGILGLKEHKTSEQ
eukprot:TRINITY_DN979_c0_g1_i1.p1 TRINITY_DN979_c0_g1~~TRINITY_DN979_c0_g1_i1.p1  ORF type:complete len:998 (+),score=184.85 TRINITY_DN979_c0_g1_i1:199-3192(+)